jgi:hypothetical protein
MPLPINSQGFVGCEIRLEGGLNFYIINMLYFYSEKSEKEKEK